MEKMMMPAYYNVLSTEEMTYTEGGATATMSEALLCWLIPPYGWFKGVTAVRDYRRKNPNTWMEKGLDPDPSPSKCWGSYGGSRGQRSRL